MGLKKMSCSNCISSGCFGFGSCEMLSMSLTIPCAASQFGSTDQFEPSVGVHSWSSHILLRPSATGFSTPGQWQMAIMLYDSIDSFQRLWWTLIFSCIRQSRSAWQSVSISTGDPYTYGANSFFFFFFVSSFYNATVHKTCIAYQRHSQQVIGERGKDYTRDKAP
jgi:hypothetical protein